MKIVVLCDLHFGPSKNNENIYNSLSQVVYPYILNNSIDLIVICGDDTDDRISLDQIASRYWLQFWKDITSFKKPDGSPIPVRGLSGTESHQRNQLQSLQFWVKDTDVNVKLFETCGVENFNGLNFLYIPEESVYDKYKFYKNTLFSDNKYDMVFGHGMFDFIGNNGWGVTEERSLKGSPIWNIEDFKNVKGCVCFGHIHIAQNYKNFIYYGGSLTRFCQGEDAPKGFICVDYDSNAGTHSVEFIENPLAPQLKTISLPNDICEHTADDIINYIVSSKSIMNANELRVMINRDIIDLSKLQIVQRYFNTDRSLGVRIEVKKTCIQQAQSLDQINQNSCDQQPVNIFSSQFPEINDPLDWQFNTISYAKNKYGVDINKNDMIDIIGKCIQQNN